ncbi:Penicillin-binding protein 1A [Piscirickettsia salmonis]|uniref:Penicillin-binding protein 1A n=1 Tax=Piscirickettsia salmonis TaxID=1238 RepID=A0A1L6TFD1_PISSA|nr:penicillin-binding protein 1A [Piscirickettsia salmonis]AKP72341.1 peptidase [Piscirickettsia salmonis LF-89 = ATCC VR-1361]ALB24206.1 penicillin-binding, 1A family protein [Piscirickettsia salmonis]ALY04005.1 peptidase [Piscirickettsia salmonis]AMA43569.1 peptidase [Piscirickettsia salmonis]AOS36038.1 peptidase [Piscirickettsia salmonis]
MKALRVFTWFAISLLLIVMLVTASLLYYMANNLPDVSTLRSVQLQEPLRIYSADDKLIAEIGNKRRIPVSLAEIPQDLIHAILATEDHRFYQHSGVDIKGLARAVIGLITTGEKRQGGSTITMQVARNFFLSRKKTYLRKFNEILLAFKIEHELTKNEILSLYLNKIYLGQRAYGVGAAAKIYYGETVSQLDLAEMAMIAGLPQAPSAINPIYNPNAAKKRRSHVLTRMLRYGYINHAQYQKAMVAPIKTKFHRTKTAVYAPHVAEMVRRYITELFPKTAYTGGFKVYTTIDSSLQTAINQALENGLTAYDRRHGYRGPISWINLQQRSPTDLLKQFNHFPSIKNKPTAIVTTITDNSAEALLKDGQKITIPWQGLAWARRYINEKRRGPAPKQTVDILKPGDVILVQYQKDHWQLTQKPAIEGAAVSLNSNNGAVLALIGGLPFTQSNFNRAIQAERQPGSSFKPFVYSAALEKGYTAASIINDSPIVLPGNETYELWRPQNDNRRFRGATRLRTGLTHSMNLISIRLLQDIGIDYTHQYVQRFGFAAQSLPQNLSLALGTNTITPLQLAAAYSSFANSGYRVIPFYIDRIVNSNHKILFQAAPPTIPRYQQGDQPQAPRIISAQNAYIMTSIMQDVARLGTAKRTQELKRQDIAGKTGTTSEQQDGWFAGFTPDVVTTVWVGFDSPQPTGEYSSTLALPIWIDYMKTALNYYPERRWPRPDNLVTLRIDPNTGQLAHDWQKETIFETFRKKYAPKHYSNQANTHLPGDLAQDLF